MVNTAYVERQIQREDSTAATQSTRYGSNNNPYSNNTNTAMSLFKAHVEEIHSGERIEPEITTREDGSQFMGCLCGDERFVVDLGQKTKVDSGAPLKSPNYDAGSSTQYNVSFNNGEKSYATQPKAYASAA